ncbi:MAG: AraC family transcriptional regulator [Cytophagales bacterium]|nr:AraC family transcriptional regulator [Cytophagales bacterium]
MEQALQTDYKIRINRVFEYIETHLDGDLSLGTLAEIGYFSSFHFHRVFKAITSETVNEYVTRKRLERSALDLLHKDQGISEVALKYGFNDNSSFTRAFKKFYGSSPSAFRKDHPHRFSKIRQLESKNGQSYPDQEKYLRVIDKLKNWISMNAKIKVEEMPAMELAYVACTGPENMPAAYQKLIRWATPKGLIEGGKLVTIYYDSYKVTESSKVRMSACLLLNQPTETDGEIGLTSIKSGKCIIGSFEIGMHEYEQSWTGLFVWMNENGYQKADREPFEIYHNDFNQHPEKKSIVDFCIPVF